MKTKLLKGIKRLLASALILTICLGSMHLTALAEGIQEERLDYSVIEDVNDGEQTDNLDIEEIIEILAEEYDPENIDETQTVAVYENEGLKYTFTLYSSWDTGYNASIRIDNNTEKTIEDWKIEMLYDYSLSSVWNAVIVSDEKGKYVIKNDNWNQDIYPGSYIEFGISGQEGFVAFPTAYRMLNSLKQNSSENYSIEYNVTYEWGGGFTGRVTIINNGKSSIEDWVLEFDSENEITSAWDCIIISQEECHYIVKNPGYNQNIAPGTSVSFGFNVNEKESNNEFRNYELKSYGEDIKEDDGEIPVQDEEETEEDYITPEQANFDECPEPGEFESIGEAYVKEASWEDVITNESGIQYVKNQILISAYMGADKEIFEELAEEVGANMVGYIELTNDYQFEFADEKTFDELNIIIDYLNSYSFISAVTLNYAYETETEEETNDKLYTDNYYCINKKYGMYDYDGNGIHDLYNTTDTRGTAYLKSTANGYKKDDWDETNPKGDNWGLETLNVLSAWDYVDNSSSVKVGVYDIGFTRKHIDLQYSGLENNIDIEVRSKIDNNGKLKFENDAKHGTHVAGIIAAIHNNNQGISGVATNVELYAYGCGNPNVEGKFVSSIMGDKLAYATLVGNHVKVINYSMGYDDNIVFAASNNNSNALNKIKADSSAMEEFLLKLYKAGYDFVICQAAGNAEDNSFIKDSSIYGYTDVENLIEIPPMSIQEHGKVMAKYCSPLSAIENDFLEKRIIVVGAIKKDVIFGARENESQYSYSLSYYSNRGSRIDVVAPGDDILSTVPISYDPSGYALLDGTSMASPFVAGIVALMYQANPNIKSDVIKQYLRRSSSVTEETEGRLIPNAKKCVEQAKNYIPNEANDISYPSGIIMGITKSDKQLLGGVQFTAYRKGSVDTIIDAYNEGIYYFGFESREKLSEMANNEGQFEVVLPEGIYDFYVSKDGYLPLCIKDISVERDASKTIETIYLTKWTKMQKNEQINGTVINALTSNKESEVTINVRKNWNNKTGDYVKNSLGKEISASSSLDGTFNIKVPIGSYTVELQKDGFITEYYNVTSNADGEILLMVVCPSLSDDDYRIVLTWNDVYDLDAHLSYYQNDEWRLHCCYGCRNITYSEDQTVLLDLDSRWNGPETITITKTSKFIQDGGVFKFSVHNYSNFNEYDSYIWEDSNAKVKVYSGNKLINTYYVPETRKGTVWHVFDLSEEGIEKVDEFYSVNDIDDIK